MSEFDYKQRVVEYKERFDKNYDRVFETINPPIDCKCMNWARVWDLTDKEEINAHHPRCEHRKRSLVKD